MKVRPPLSSFELVRHLKDVDFLAKIEAKSDDCEIEVTPLISRTS